MNYFAYNWLSKLTYLVDSVASKSLIAINPKEGFPTLRNVLVRMALSNSTLSSAAVLQSLLALSSLHRHGVQSHAARLKLSALTILSTSAKTGVDPAEVMSHVASLMLLCCFEVRVGIRLGFVALTSDYRSNKRRKPLASGCAICPVLKIC